MLAGQMDNCPLPLSACSCCHLGTACAHTHDSIIIGSALACMQGGPIVDVGLSQQHFAYIYVYLPCDILLTETNQIDIVASKSSCE